MSGSTASTGRFRSALRALRTRLLGLDPAALQDRVRSLESELDRLRSSVDLGREAWHAFEAARTTPEFLGAFEQPEPLVTVCVATFNRAGLLTGRCLPSILGQTYRNLEVVVVGDGCTDDTGAAVERLGDPRVRFENLPARGVYPAEPRRRWMVAGTAAVNRALQLANGAFITHLDDDDAYAPGRIEALLRLAQQARAEVVHHPFAWERPDGTWAVNPADAFRKFAVTSASVFYHRWFRNIPWDPEAHLLDEPGDWNRYRKFLWLGARIARHPDSLLKHYRERNNQP